MFTPAQISTVEPLLDLDEDLEALEKKAYDEQFYTKYCGAKLGYVKDTLELMKALDIYAEALYFNQKLDGSGTDSVISSKTEIGGIYETGFRLQAHKIAEIDLAYRYVSGDLDESFIVAGGIVKVTKRLGISVNAAFGDDDDEEYFAGIRLHF